MNFISGQLNNITSSYYDGAFGFGNTILPNANTTYLFGNSNTTVTGSTIDNSFVSGSLNKIGSATTALNNSFVSGGQNILTSGNGCGVFGNLNTVKGNQNFIAGINNICDNANGNIIAGDGNKVSLSGSDDNAVFGGANIVSTAGALSSFNLVAGSNNKIDQFFNVVGGRNNIVDGTNNFVVGRGNTSRFNFSAAMGDGATVTSNEQFMAAFRSGYVFKTGAATGAEILPGASAWTAVSDRTTKENILNNNYGLKEIMKLGTYSYNYIGNPTSNRNIGVISQEVRSIMPELAPTMSTGKIGVNYNDLTVVLIKAVQEQQQQIEMLKLEIQKLRK